MLLVERAALGRDRRASGTVRVAATDDTATYLIAPHLAEFRRRHPGISLEIVVRMDLANLSRREADIALRGVRPARGDFIIRRFGSWDFGLYAAKSYAASRGLKPGLTDLSGLDIITWNDEYAQVRGGPWLAEHARGAAVALTSNSRRIHHAACKAGIGVAILPCQLADREPDLICLLSSERVLSVKLWLVASRDLLRAARVRAVMDFLAELGAHLRREGSTDRRPRQHRANTDT
jgi:DNA-binding transcriptional LysR family regulator